MSKLLREIWRRAVESPGRIAVVDDQRSWPYIHLLGGALHLAEKLEATTGRQNIGLLLPTSGAFSMSLLAAWMLGRTAVPINYLLSPRERQYIVDDSEIDTVITAGPMLEFLGERPGNVKLLELDHFKIEGPPPLRWFPKRADTEAAVILYTSGTSGKPKGVMLTHGNVASNAWNSVAHVNFSQTDTFLGVLPQFHSFGLMGLTLIPMAVGSTVVYTARFVPRKVWELVRKHKPQIFMGVPSMYNALLTVKEATAEDFACLRMAVSGGEPLPRSVYDRFLERFGVRIGEGYGLTETSPIVSLNVPGRSRVGSVGQLIPECDVKIAGEQGQPLGPDEQGEVLIAGPNIMAGYFKLPEMTSEVMTHDGYFRSGDWGKLDQEGYLYITGRKKEMLIIAGENVFPREIEEVLNQHPSVKASAVIGVNDGVRGELPLAFVELNEGASFDESALRRFCRDHLAGFKVPREIRVIDQLPRNPTGKIMRRQLSA